MNTKAGICIVLAVVAAGAGWWVWRNPNRASDGSGPSRTAGSSSAMVADEVASALEAARGNRTSPGAFGDLKAALLRMDRQEAAEWITQRLNSGEDFATGLDVTIGQGGTLTGWSTLRVFLLDMLFIVDPAAAAALSRRVLQTPSSADEWALAMRNVGAGSPSTDEVALLKTKSAEMLHNETWRKEASAGYLQAFDVIVHTKNVSLSPELIQYTGDTANKAVRHAAFLTLDRLTMAEPAAMLEKLIPSAAAQPETALMVSNMVARADVRDPAQRRLVEDYLLDEKRTGTEIQAFTGSFPNANQFVSANLLTKTATVSGSELAAHDRAALEVVRTWLGDPRFSRLHAPLQGTAERLKTFVIP